MPCGAVSQDALNDGPLGGSGSKPDPARRSPKGVRPTASPRSTFDREAALGAGANLRALKLREGGQHAGHHPTHRAAALGSNAKLFAELGPERAECLVTVAERDDGVPELRIEYSHEDPIAFRAYFDPSDPGPDGS